MTMTLSGDGTITGLVAGGLPDATITTDELAAGASLNNAPNSVGFRNRIINGDMRIDQRNAGASVTPTDQTYSLDRWKMYVSQASKYTAQQSTTAPAGFSNSLLITSSSAYAVGASERFMFGQGIEGYNAADLDFGTANAKTVTLSFWVRSSLTGTFGGSFGNVDSTRTYPFTYTISSADTWEQKSVTVAGDTSGTWNKTTGGGLWIYIGLGVGSTLSGTAGSWSGSTYFSATGATSVVGTNGATLYITGVQLEVGSVATPFERRPYGTELALCQRYLPAWNWVSANELFGFGYSISTTQSLIQTSIPVTPRVAPTGITASALTNFTLRNGSNTGGTPTAVSVNVLSSSTNQSILVTTTAGSPTLTAGQGSFLFASGAAQILFTGCEL